MKSLFTQLFEAAGVSLPNKTDLTAQSSKMFMKPIIFKMSLDF